MTKKSLNHDNIEKLLENTVAKSVFYSCLNRPASISHIARLWDYKNDSFFFQEKQRKIIQNMVDQNLILKDYDTLHLHGDSPTRGYLVNYEAVFSYDNVNEFIMVNGWNDAVISHGLVHEFMHDDDKDLDKLDDTKYKDFLLASLSPKKRQEIKNLTFNTSEIKKLWELWNSTGFKEIFLDPRCLSTIFSRDALPTNPIFWLFLLTYRMMVIEWQNKTGELSTHNMVHLVSYASSSNDKEGTDDTILSGNDTSSFNFIKCLNRILFRISDVSIKKTLDSLLNDVYEIHRAKFDFDRKIDQGVKPYLEFRNSIYPEKLSEDKNSKR